MREAPQRKGETGEEPSGRFSLQRAQHTLKSRYAEDRLRSIGELARMDSPEAPRLLVGAMRDRLSYVGAAAARALAVRMSTEIADAMIGHFEWASEDGLNRDAGCSVRHEIAIALGNSGARKADAILMRGLKTVQVEMVGFGLEDTAVGLRANCALALAQIRPAGILVDLTLLLFDSGPDAPCISDTTTARRAAAKAIAALGDPGGSVPLILKLCSLEEDPEVLLECMNGLVALEEARALEFIQPHLKRNNPMVAAGAAMALGRTRSAAALAPLLETLDFGRPELTEALATAVATLRLPAARDALFDRTFHTSAVIRAASAAALGLFPDADAHARLRSLAREDRDLRVRQAAARGLGES